MIRLTTFIAGLSLSIAVGFLWVLAIPIASFPQTVLAGTVVTQTFHSKALEGNLVSDSVDRGFTVYLPPNYQKSDRHYPVIYVLHGAFDTYKAWTEDPEWANIPKIMDRLIASGKIRDMIVVMPDGDNKFGTPAYTNSVTTGNWEDYITVDLVQYVDSKYRTLPNAESRGIAGHSIGAYAALKLAMKHPDIYGSVYALSPCCLEWDNNWSPSNPSWDKALNFKNMADIAVARKFVQESSPSDPKWSVAFAALGDVALSAAWSPNPERAPFLADFPVERRGKRLAYVQRARAAWIANLIVPMLGQYRSNLMQLSGIAFDIGNRDWNQSLIRQAHDLDLALNREHIRHEFEEYVGTHTNRIPERIESKTLPFFSRVLK